MHRYNRSNRRGQKSRARRTAQRLFLRLRNGNKFSEHGVIRVSFAERYPKKKCVIAVVIPVKLQLLAKVEMVGIGHLWCHHQPVIMNSWNSAQLRVMYRFQNINPGDNKLVLGHARELAEWMGSIFGMKAIVSPMKSLFGLRWKLRALI